jgi:hypothetical protein
MVTLFLAHGRLRIESQMIPYPNSFPFHTLAVGMADFSGMIFAQFIVSTRFTGAKGHHRFRQKY